MQQIPNIITSVRLIAAMIILMLSLFAPDHGTSCFVWLFVAAGISDMLDGFIARRFNWCTAFGATLDSVSDLSLYVSSIVFLYQTSQQALSANLPVVLIGAMLQTLHLCYSYQRFGRFPAYHSDFTRACAYLIFFVMLAFCQSHNSLLIGAIATIWTVCSLEGMIITTLLKTPMSDIKGISVALQNRRDFKTKQTVTARTASSQTS
ncbi:MAG: CDP-alcohol phosphatidyltransferase family protein [Candidatus Obscuribacter sp.]|jgi:phosphatidylglycerophosphate synthase|nr:CDP-alcohol phosphatidyltransferase family protein [Candidatus Obscuribacter sp.]MBK7841375.1 CDP-alcohol phosphatidyltransferase family protein [Candidatus Obscuribacter sp.]MBK9622273.1 CDP-alcohol phosphatidyltransferase family protein [Candidatus Obscuribacter sp.]MBK9773036.1 CDP-alcohol phosphatidyltransferase family protein [Candidatus Obscuribacter sp.]MBL0186615.1 CDP-alcohol phosphatidyltransferase family protein [Candidatus Obscuribacter sp.]